MAWKGRSPRRLPPIPTWSNSSATSRPSLPPAARSATRDGARPKSICRPCPPGRMPPLLPQRKSKLSKKTVSPSYVIGIDLGTTNSALAFAELQMGDDPFAPANVQLLAIPQLVNPGEARDEDLLPSFLYLPGSTDFPAGTIALPWDDE